MSTDLEILRLEKLSLSDVGVTNSECKRAFLGRFPEILNSASSLVTSKKAGDGIDDIADWITTVMAYNVPNGKHFRAHLCLVGYSQLVPSASKQQMDLARILGWIGEIGQAAALVADDIMDNGVNRRGSPCWYLVNNKGNLAFNDVLLLEHVSYQLLRKYFGDMDVYSDLLDLTLRTTFKTVLGQSLDTQVDKKRSFDEYTPELYHSIVVYKTAYYTVFLPVANAMTLAGISPGLEENKKTWEIVEEITIKIGELFQIQDDYLDCFGDESLLGKVGTDIQEGKCTWLFVTAKDLCTKDQYQELKDHYGSSRDEDVSTVKHLYETLGLPAKFKEHKENVRAELETAINNIENIQLALILQATIHMIYDRQT